MCSLIGFSIQEYYRGFFYCQKTTFICEFQHTPLWKLMISQGSTPYVGMRFCGHVPNSPRNKAHFICTSKSGFFGSQKTVTPLGRGKRNFSSSLNVMISKMVIYTTKETIKDGTAYLRLTPLAICHTLLMSVESLLCKFSSKPPRFVHNCKCSFSQLP
jgi:hypothetical protein